jgi:hypothetical protein
MQVSRESKFRSWKPNIKLYKNAQAVIEILVTDKF